MSAVFAHIRSRLNGRALVILIAASLFAYSVQLGSIIMAVPMAVMGSGSDGLFVWISELTFNHGAALVPLGWIVYLVWQGDSLQSAKAGVVVAAGLPAFSLVAFAWMIVWWLIQIVLAVLFFSH